MVLAERSDNDLSFRRKSKSDSAKADSAAKVAANLLLEARSEQAFSHDRMSSFLLIDYFFPFTPV